MKVCLYDGKELTVAGHLHSSCEDGHGFTDELLEAFTDSEWERLRAGKWVKQRFGDLRWRNGMIQRRHRPNRKQRAWSTYLETR